MDTCMAHYYYVYSLQPPCFVVTSSCPTCSSHPPWFTPPSSLFYLQELKLPVYRAHSPQIGMRRYFADLLAILSNRYQLCPTARHLAVYLLDLFMDHYDVAVKQLYVIALSCLLLASKSRSDLSAPSINKATCFLYYPQLGRNIYRGALSLTVSFKFRTVCVFILKTVSFVLSVNTQVLWGKSVELKEVVVYTQMAKGKTLPATRLI